MQGLRWIAGQWVATALLLTVMATGAYTDIRWRRLPNWLTFGTAIAGLTIQVATRGLDGGRDSVLGWLLGCALLFLPFALGGIGAGDVKFLGAVGAVMGVSFVFNSFLYMALAGGLLALFYAALRGGLLSILRQFLATLWLAARSLIIYRSVPPAAIPVPVATPRSRPSSSSSQRLTTIGLPYGVAIAAGALITLAVGL